MVVSLGIVEGAGYEHNEMPNSVVFLGKDSTNAYTRAISFDSVRVSIGGHCKGGSRYDDIFKLLKSFLTFCCPFKLLFD